MIIRWVLLLCIFLSFSADAQGTRRGVAIVIGNAKYTSSPLRNPVNDARDVGKKLTEAGFATWSAFDTTNAQLRRALDLLVGQVKPSEPVIIFYSGHGFQAPAQNPHDGTDNYLMPIDARLETPETVGQQAVGFMEIVRKLEVRRPGPVIVILDACRNNPFLRSWSKTRSLVTTRSGLVEPNVKALHGLYVIFATAPGDVSSDGSRANGLFTSHLLRYLSSPGWSINRVFEETSAAVAAESANDQIPWFTGSGLAARFQIVPLASAGSQAPISSGRQADSDYLDGLDAYRRQDFLSALRKFESAAQSGNSTAAYYAGDILFHGRQGEADLARAAHWLDRASQQGNSNAMADYAYMLYRGHGIAPDATRARQLLETAAHMGNVRALQGLGRMYIDGTAVPANSSLAIKYLTQAADAGEGRAMYDIGRLYELGRGVSQDLMLASRWFERATQSSSEPARTWAKQRLEALWGPE